MTDSIKSATKPFPPETLAELFEVIEINDVVDPQVSLPDPIILECTRETMRHCFTLSLQFWTEGVNRTDLLQLISTLLRMGDLSPADRMRYKHIRAKYKHLRSAVILFDARHRPPVLFNKTVTIMGKLQDALHNGQRLYVIIYALWLRVLLSRFVWAMVRRKLSAIQLDTVDNFLAYRKSEIRLLKKALAQERVTGHQFHSMRKIVSRHVSFYNNLQSLEPHDDHHLRIARFLSAINGLMGSRHDKMVEQAMTGERDYRTDSELDGDIRQRLEQLVNHYPL